MNEVFETHLKNHSHAATATGADFVRDHFATRRSWYVVHFSSTAEISEISRVSRTIAATFVVYSMKGDALTFQYRHSWEDADSGSGFDYPRQMYLYFDGQGIFDTAANTFSRTTMWQAKLALLGLAPHEAAKADLVSDQVIIAFLCTIGIYAADWTYVSSAALKCQRS